MTASAQPTAPGMPSWLGRSLLGLAAVAVIAALVLGGRWLLGGEEGDPLPTFVLPGASSSLAFDVAGAENGRLTLAARGTEQSAPTLDLAPSAPVEFLQPAAIEALRPGDWLSLIAIPNEVKNYSVRLIVIFPAPARPDGDGFGTTPAGFRGHETSRDARERPVTGGLVERIDGTTVTLATTGGQMKVEITPKAPLRVLKTGTAAEIAEGDRLALHTGAGGTIDPARGVIVLVGGAR